MDIVKDFDSKPLQFGDAVHPQPYQNLVIISTNAKNASVVTLHADTGKVGWKTPGLYGTLSSPIIRKFQGRDQILYISNETLKKKSLWPEVRLNCVSADGKERWHTGAKPMFGRGSMILADGKLVIRDSSYGKLYLVEPSSKGYRQLAVANPFDNKRRDLKRWSPGSPDA